MSMLATWMLAVLKIILDPCCPQQFLGHIYVSTALTHRRKSFEAQQFLRQANQFYFLRPRLLAADAAECRTLRFIGRRRVDTRQSLEQAEQPERGMLHCSPRARDPSSLLQGSQHKQTVEAFSPWPWIGRLPCAMVICQ